MKKLLVLSFMFALSVSIMAQRSGSTTTLLPNETYKTLTMLPVDTVYATSYWTFALGKTKTQYFSFAVRVDTATLTSPDHIRFTVWGSIDNVAFTNTGTTTVNFGGSIDSTFAMSDVTTGVLWRYLKLQAVSTNPERRAHRIGAISLKVGEK